MEQKLIELLYAATNVFGVEVDPIELVHWIVAGVEVAL